MKKYLPRKSSGFTLIEILVVITIIAILAIAVYAALNPAQRLKDTRDAKRGSDVNEILTAIHQSIVDDKGTLPTNLNSMTNDTEQQLGSGNATECPASVGSKCTGLTTTCVNLLLGTDNLTNYLASMPVDPVGASTANSTFTGYTIRKAASGILTIKACHTDAATAVQVSR